MAAAPFAIMKLASTRSRSPEKTMMVLPSPAGDCGIFCVTPAPEPFFHQRHVVVSDALVAQKRVTGAPRPGDDIPRKSRDRCGDFHDLAVLHLLHGFKHLHDRAGHCMPLQSTRMAATGTFAVSALPLSWTGSFFVYGMG